MEDHKCDAAAILAALPDDWCGHADLASEMVRDRLLQLGVVKEANATIATLRAALEDAGYLADSAKHLTDHLSSEHPDWYCEDMDTTQHFAAKVRAAVVPCPWCGHPPMRHKGPEGECVQEAGG
jgi:hypothetical protein